jgi:hypothetical protein
MSGAHEPTQHGAHRIPRFLRALGHRPQDHAEHGPGAGQHEEQYTADNIDPGAIVEQLSASRDNLGRIAELTNRQLNAIWTSPAFVDI